MLINMHRYKFQSFLLSETDYHLYYIDRMDEKSWKALISLDEAKISS